MAQFISTACLILQHQTEERRKREGTRTAISRQQHPHSS